MPDQAHPSPEFSDPDAAFLAFYLGPVQPFIAGARTVRDLWTGSYLLAWLTFTAIRKVLDTPGASLVSPNLPEGHPLLWTLKKAGNPPKGVTTPCIPNRFIARVPRAVDVHALADACEKACRVAWAEIGDKLRKSINAKIGEMRSCFRVALNGRSVDLLAVPWDRLWDAQMNSFFEVRTAVLFPDQLTDELRKSLLDPVPDANRAPMDILFGLMDARRSVRHVSDYRADGDVPQKCTLLGIYEQMGPARLDESREFWRLFAEHVTIDGTRVREGERLCAVSLVKRFAWPAYLRAALGVKDVRDLHYSDSATVAAKQWLRGDAKRKVRELDPEGIRRDFDDWSGQWLHWSKRDQDKDDPCPEKIWKDIAPVLTEKRRVQGAAPAYYAILMADADKLGDKLATQGEKVSTALTHFALDVVRDAVERHHGELIYSGGDDTLALLPTETAVACARQVQQAYVENWKKFFKSEKDPATLSAGLAVVHYKEDLRYALEEARKAELLAKRSGRNALALAVCRRSGEHTAVAFGWSQAVNLQALVDYFLADSSDRWTYKLRTLLPTFQGMPWESYRAELKRLLGRVEAASDNQREAFEKQVLAFADGYHREMTGERERTAADVMTDFVTLCQSASFLARGRDAR